MMTLGRAAIYCRISKDREGAGLGVQRQEQDCRVLAASTGLAVVAVYTDNDISAYSGRLRPDYMRLLSDLGDGKFDTVICWHTDRLHRSPIELEEYISLCRVHDVQTHTVKGGMLDLKTPEGMLRAGLLGQVARYESAHKSQRITRKKLELAHSGKFSGGPVPFGWFRHGGRMSVVDEDAREIQNAITATIAGASIGSIVRDLNARGILTRRGQKWTSTAVRNMLIRPTNAGLSAYRGEVVGTSEFPAIISEDEWRTVKAIITNPSRRTQTDSRVKHLLAGLLRCSTCDSPMKTSSRAGRPDSSTRFYYKCPTAGTGHAYQTAGPIEDLISDTVVSKLAQPGVLEVLVGPADHKNQSRLQDEAAALRGRLGEAAESFADGLIDAKQMEAITAKIRGKLEALEHDLALASRATIIPSSASEDFRGWWDATSMERQRAVIDALMVVHVAPVGNSAPRVFDPNRVLIGWR